MSSSLLLRVFADADADNGEESPVPVMSDGDELGQHHPPLHLSHVWIQSTS